MTFYINIIKIIFFTGLTTTGQPLVHGMVILLTWIHMEIISRMQDIRKNLRKFPVISLAQHIQK